MKYVATVKNKMDHYSKSFDKVSDAMQWLDEQNNNLEKTTYIEEYDDNWNKVDGFFYTEAK